MTRDGIFAPFSTLEQGIPAQGNLTGLTTRYSVNVSCQPVIPWENNGNTYYNSSFGCSYLAPLPRTSTDTALDDSKIFDAVYAGFWNIDGNAKYYLSNRACPLDASNTFLAQWSKLNIPPSVLANISADEWRQHAEIEALWCRTEYFQQRVQATIALPNSTVASWSAAGDAIPLPADLFNSTLFENAMNTGVASTDSTGPPPDGYTLRTDFPTQQWPDQASYLEKTAFDTANLAPMVPFAIGATQFEMDDYLNGTNLANAYQSAYRVLFARQLADVLSSSLDNSTTNRAVFAYTTQAIALEPAFTYAVESLLAVATISAIGLLFYNRQRPSHLAADPSTISSLMSLVAGDKAMLDSFLAFDRATSADLVAQFKNEDFELVKTGSDECASGLRMRRTDHFDESFREISLSKGQTHILEAQDSSSQISGVYPTELSLKVGALFLTFQLALGGGIAAIYFLIQTRNGLPLPSSNTFIRQLVENYLLTAVGTLIEPFWVVLNRNLCCLQPFEALRKGHKSAKKSVGLDYGSLPPQLVIAKALVNKNFLLAAVCLMTLFANILSVALSGLLHEDIVDVASPAVFKQSLSARFQDVNGSDVPFVRSTGGTVEPFFILESNRTAHTPLPPWTDASWYHIPTDNDTSHSGLRRRITTDSIGANLACQPLSSDSSFVLTDTGFSSSNFSDVNAKAELSVILKQGDRKIQCVPRNTDQAGRSLPGVLFARPTGPSAMEFTYALQGTNRSSAADAAFCLEHVAAGWIRADLVAGEKRRTDDSSIPIITEDAQSNIIVCRSQLMSAQSDITVSPDGHIIESTTAHSVVAAQGMFSTTVSDVLGQAHQFIINRGDRWHNDTNPSDWGNYLIGKTLNSTRLLDPRAPLPTYDEVVTPFSNLYSELFAVWLGRNREQLLTSSAVKQVDGQVLVPTTRIFISKTMFILAESILLTYVVVTLALYIRRPWKILCRLPSDLASIIAFFAASRAIEDFEGTAHLSKRQRSTYERGIKETYGFGTFISEDGRNHLGIEKHPYVARLVRSGSVSSAVAVDEKGGLARNLRKLRHWKSGKAMEGGWL